MSAGTPTTDGEMPHPDVVICPDGPLLLRGNHVVEAADGTRHPTTRPVSAVCRCGHTATAPWCDGTHKLVRSRGPEGRPSEQLTRESHS